MRTVLVIREGELLKQYPHRTKVIINVLIAKTTPGEAGTGKTSVKGGFS